LKGQQEPDAPLDFILVGLGNPEDGYKNTRHNVGFEIINKIAFDFDIPVIRSKHKALVGVGNISDKRVMLVKPQTYMNRSGESVRAVLDFYKMPPSSLIVISDEVNLNLGKIRVREKGSAGGQNGMKNIIYHLDTDIFTRVRIGIGPKPDTASLSNYVLSPFNKSERPTMIEAVTAAAEATICILKEGTVAAMNRYN